MSWSARLCNEKNCHISDFDMITMENLPEVDEEESSKFFGCLQGVVDNEVVPLNVIAERLTLLAVSSISWIYLKWPMLLFSDSDKSDEIDLTTFAWASESGMQTIEWLTMVLLDRNMLKDLSITPFSFLTRDTALFEKCKAFFSLKNFSSGLIKSNFIEER